MISEKRLKELEARVERPGVLWSAEGRELIATVRGLRKLLLEAKDVRVLRRAPSLLLIDKINRALGDEA